MSKYMNTEEEFFRSLRSVVVHMIKHVEPGYKLLMGPLKAYDDGDWDGFSRESRAQKIEELARQLEGDSRITQYFAAYPHKYSKERFAKFRTSLDAYRRELKGA